jgi:hypothetical protein
MRMSGWLTKLHFTCQHDMKEHRPLCSLYESLFFLLEWAGSTTSTRDGRLKAKKAAVLLIFWAISDDNFGMLRFILCLIFFCYFLVSFIVSLGFFSLQESLFRSLSLLACPSVSCLYCLGFSKKLNWKMLLGNSALFPS